MNKNEAKDIVQRKSLNAWAKRKCKGTLQLCTGAGKTYVAIRAIEWVFTLNPDAKVLVICPTEIIRDDTFPKEFKKWKKTELLKKVDIKCIQTVYKWDPAYYDLIVADEIHNYIPEKADYDSKAYEYHKFFERNTYDKLLGLSAWIPEKKRAVIRKIAPVAYTLTTDDGVKYGVISPYTEYNIAISLNEKEKAAYNKVQYTYLNLEKRLGGSGLAFGNANEILKDLKGIPQHMRSRDDKIRYSLAIQFWKTMQKRKKMLYEMPSKLLAVRKLIDQAKIDKSVIFSQSTLFADHICVQRSDIIPYHSKVQRW
jgi:superfamily II DNA or RNA helicase